MILSFKKHSYPSEPFNSSVVQLVSDESVAAGSVIRNSSFKEVNSRDSLNHFKSSDFSVENLLAIGAVDVLKSTFHGVRPSVIDADSFEESYNSLTHEVSKEA